MKELLVSRRGKAKCHKDGTGSAYVRMFGNALWLEEKKQGTESEVSLDRPSEM